MELNLLGLFALAFTAAVALPGPNVAFAVARVLCAMVAVPPCPVHSASPWP